MDWFSLGIHLTGQKKGVWIDRATGECGDFVSLFSKLHPHSILTFRVHVCPIFERGSHGSEYISDLDRFRQIWDELLLESTCLSWPRNRILFLSA
jgi:hypothetical protein